MSQFTGSYDGTFDAKKGRLSVPATFRQKLAQLNAEEVMLRASDGAPSIEVWPQPVYQEVLAEALRGVGRFTPEFARLSRKWAASAITARVDGDGRLVLPDALIKHAKLEGPVSFVGMVDLFHIWTPALYAEQLARDAELEAAA